MSNEALLIKTAEVLEKAAAYIDYIENNRVTQEHATKTKVASELAQRLSQTTGTPVTEDFVRKLAELSPDMQSMIAGLAGTEAVDPMGGPQDSGNTKQASINPEMPSGDVRFLNWVTGD
jgi:hypothetical protein